LILQGQSPLGRSVAKPTGQPTLSVANFRRIFGGDSLIKRPVKLPLRSFTGCLGDTGFNVPAASRSMAMIPSSICCRSSWSLGQHLENGADRRTGCRRRTRKRRRLPEPERRGQSALLPGNEWLTPKKRVGRPRRPKLSKRGRRPKRPGWRSRQFLRPLPKEKDAG
jgi:hypothetical protein